MTAFEVLRNTVADVYGLNRTLLLGKATYRKHSVPRQALYTAAVEALGLSWPVVGRLTDRDRSSVRKGHIRHMERLKSDPLQRLQMRKILGTYTARMCAR